MEWNGTDLIMKSNAKSYISPEIFLDYIQTVLLPNLAELRRLDELDELDELNELNEMNEFAEEMAVLLMDNCPSHITCVVLCCVVLCCAVM
jgi:hypothetical protein